MPLKEEKINNKREAILKAGASLFANKSYHKVMMADIAKMAGIAKGTVYLYFSSKEELYYSILCSYIDELISILKKEINSSPNTVLSFKSYVKAIFAYLVKNKEFHLIFKKETLTNKNGKCSEVKRHTETLKNLLKPILQKGVDEKLFEIPELEFTLDILIGSIFSAAWHIMALPQQAIEIESYNLFSILIKSITYNKTLSLLNKNIVLASGENNAKLSSEKFEAEGANLLLIPSIRIVPLNLDKFREMFKQSFNFDYIAFSSSNAVNIFIDFIKKNEIVINKSTVLAVTGAKTAETLAKLGYNAGCIPKTFSAKGLLNALSKNGVKGKRVLIPKSSIGRDELIEGLKQLGAEVIPLDIYDTVLPAKNTIEENINKLKIFKADIFAFTSPSTFNNFIKMLKIKNVNKYFLGKKIAVIGTTTQEAVIKSGLTPDIIPDKYTIEGIVNKIKEYYNGVIN